MEKITAKKLAARLKHYLRKELNEPKLQYQTLPTSLKGGYVSNLFKFQLKNVSTEMSIPLVLRLLPTSTSSLREEIVQNTLSNAGYPAPYIFTSCSDTTILGAEFNVMEFKPGKHLMSSYDIEVVPEKLAQTHIDLHKVDPTPLTHALAEKGITRNFFTYINWLDAEIHNLKLDWIEPGIRWVQKNIPKKNIREVICHCDIQPFNILVDEDKISAVLDWSLFYVWEPELDVSSGKQEFRCIGPSLLPNVDWSKFFNKYYSAYIKELPLDSEKMDYYEATHCVRILVLYGMNLDVASHPDTLRRTINRFQELTGIKLQQ
jgi:aminoglycoside phosphotransferase (APT) family kinase protein